MTDVLVGMAAEIDQRGHGERLHRAVDLEIHDDPRRDGPLELRPRPGAAQGELRRKGFLRSAHQPRRLPCSLRENERMLAGAARVRKGGAQHAGNRPRPYLEPRPRLLQPNTRDLHLRELFRCRAVVRIGGDERLDVDLHRGGEEKRAVEPVHRVAQRCREPCRR